MIHPHPRKKLLMFGWHMPTPAYLRDNIAAMEKQPFDGVCIRLPTAVGGGDVFDIQQWRNTTQADRDAELAVLSAIPRSTVLTDNFVVMYGASTMDWFSDDDWDAVLENTRYCARAAKLSGSTGVCWDAEPYHDTNPWRFIELASREKHSYAEHVAIAHKRGAQFMQALQSEFPALTVFALRMLSDFAEGSPFSQMVLNEIDPAVRREKLEASWWSLHQPFIAGMLSAAEAGVTLVDGNEEAYYYTSAIEFYRIYTTLRQDALMLLPADLHDRYRQHYRIGHAVSINYLAGMWAGLLKAFPEYLTSQALELTEAQRAQWFEHNTYHALASADEYVWVYSEQSNYWTNENIPAGFIEAIRSARHKLATGQPLGIAVEQMLLDAQQRFKDKG